MWRWKKLTLSTFLSAGTGFSTSFSVVSISSFFSPHFAYFLFLSIARKSIPLESVLKKLIKFISLYLFFNEIGNVFENDVCRYLEVFQKRLLIAMFWDYSSIISISLQIINVVVSTIRKLKILVGYKKVLW